MSNGLERVRADVAVAVERPGIAGTRCEVSALFLDGAVAYGR